MPSSTHPTPAPAAESEGVLPRIPPSNVGPVYQRCPKRLILIPFTASQVYSRIMLPVIPSHLLFLLNLSHLHPVEGSRLRCVGLGRMWENVAFNWKLKKVQLSKGRCLGQKEIPCWEGAKDGLRVQG